MVTMATAQKKAENSVTMTPTGSSGARLIARVYPQRVKQRGGFDYEQGAE